MSDSDQSTVKVFLNEDSGTYAIELPDGKKVSISPVFTQDFESYLPNPDLKTCDHFCELSTCYRQGLSYLTRREHSTMQIRIKLMKKGFSQTIIKGALQALQDENSLSDFRFACEWIEQRLNSHPEGRTRLIAGLRQRGVNNSDCDRALCQITDSNPQIFTEACLNYLLKLSRNTTVIEEIAEKAKKRGFSQQNLADCSARFYTLTGKQVLDSDTK